MTRRGSRTEITLEALGSLAQTVKDLPALRQARDEIERRLLVPPAESASASMQDGSSGLGNIIGVGIGEKHVGGRPAGRVAVKVLVKEKLHAGALSRGALVPRSLGGVPIDVDASGEVRSHFNVARVRPAPGGVSIGNCGMPMAGTLGCLVKSGRRLYLLGNNHVLGLVNHSPIGAGIAQPGTIDGGSCDRDVIARLTKFVPIDFDGPNNVDAAIALVPPRRVDRRVLRHGGRRERLVPPEVAPALNLAVQKSGRSTQYRRGHVDVVAVSLNVSFAPIAGVARFSGQFRVSGLGAPFGDFGDSGALVTTHPSNQPVGLLFSGNAATNQTFCNDIRAVLRTLGVAIAY